MGERIPAATGPTYAYVVVVKDDFGKALDSVGPCLVQINQNSGALILKDPTTGALLAIFNKWGSMDVETTHQLQKRA